MHTFSETGTGVPAFLAKLWRLVEDPETNHLIYWSRDGRSFIIQNQAQFARELLPMNYKHNNMASFIRQLNMYGFHKITSIENGGLKFDRDEMEFSHPCFKRGYPYLLEHIKRKIATAKTIDEKSSMKPETVSKVLNEVKVMRGRQDALDSRFSAMKQENEALWRELAVCRQKHIKQQQIVNKLIQFLVSIVQPSSRNMTGVKRNFQLMINDVPQSSKVRKRERTSSNSGPIIHELTEELLDEVAHNNEDSGSASPHVMSPGTDARTDTSEFGDEVVRPQSNLSVGSFTESNPGEEFLLSPRSNVMATSNTPEPEMEPIIYHITELPETSEGEDNPPKRAPVTQKVTLRSSNRRGRKRKHIETEIVETENSGTSFKATKSGKIEVSEPETVNRNVLHIKKEKNIDPLSFLTQEPGQMDAVVVEPELLEALGGNANLASSSSAVGDGNGKQTYRNQDDFISAEMPADLFEAPQGNMQSDNTSYDANMEFLKNQTDRGGINASRGASSSKETYGTGENVSDTNNSLSLAKYSNDDILRLNTPRDITTHLDIVQEDLENLKDLLRGDQYTLDANTLLNNLTVGDLITMHPTLASDSVAKFNVKNPTTGDRLTLHSTIDGDTLAKLFGDSDVLGLYGLSADQLNSEGNKKGNELMTYQQPTYYPGDLSDMLNLEPDTPPKQTEYNEKRNGNNSVLNTPMPDRD